MNYFFASDVHLGLAYGKVTAEAREALFVSWLQAVEGELEVTLDEQKMGVASKGALFLVGDIFDFWFEYKHVAPKGSVRTLGQLARMCDKGIEVHLFTGNHDIWMFGYLEQELGVIVHREAAHFTLNDKHFYVAHGHGMGVRDWKYVLMNGLFNSRTAQWLFSRLVHPDVALRFGQCWSTHSRDSKSLTHEFRGAQEPVTGFAQGYLQQHEIDYFVIGHLHQPTLYPLNDRSTLVVLGEWVERPTYGLFTEAGFTLNRFSQ